MHGQQGGNGFTLIEISIVLVIIGLLVGGVLVGKDMINAAGVRAQITQIEKYNQAVNTFKMKYNALPGDMNAVTAATFGFAARGACAGEGDGNGIIQGDATGCFAGSSNPTGAGEAAGETVMFWADLSKAGLIEGSFTAATPVATGTSIPGTMIGQYLPAAKMGGDNYIYVWSGGFDASTNATTNNGMNYFGMERMTSIYNEGSVVGGSGLSVAQASGMDKKMDDGLPQSGSVMATFTNYGGGAHMFWACGWCGFSNNQQGTPDTSATPGAMWTCYDNGNVNGATQQYSITQNNGTGVNCALSFKFQ